MGAEGARAFETGETLMTNAFDTNDGAARLGSARSKAILFFAALSFGWVALANTASATPGDIVGGGIEYCADSYTTPLGHAGGPLGTSTESWVVDINFAGDNSGNAGVFAPEKGSVVVHTRVGESPYGNAVIWTSENGSEKLHIAHLAAFGKTGEVNAGDQIGVVGGSGWNANSYGVHLHVQRSVNGAPQPVVLSGNQIVPAMDYPEGVYGPNGPPCNDGRGYVSAGPYIGSSQPLTDGDLAKSPDSATVWAIAAGAKWGVSNPTELSALQNHAYYRSTIRTVPQSELDALPTEKAAKHKLVLKRGGGTVFLSSAGTLWGIPNQTELAALRALIADDKIHVVPAARDGVARMGTYSPDNYKLVIERGSGTVYLSSAGSFWAISSQTELALIRSQITTDDTLHRLPGSINAIGRIGTHTPRDGSIVKVRGINGSYLFTAGTAWHIPSVAELDAVRADITTDDTKYLVPAALNGLVKMGLHEPPDDALFVERTGAVVYKAVDGSKVAVGIPASFPSAKRVPNGSTQNLPGGLFPPTDVECVVGADGGLVASWTPPEGAVTGYSVRRWEDGVAQPWFSVEGQEFFDFGQLAAGSRQRVQVRSLGGSAASSSSDLSNVCNIPGVALTPGGIGIVEGDSGSVTVEVPITLERAIGSDVTVSFETINPGGAGMATEGVDFAATSGVLTISAGETTGYVSLMVLGDAEVEEPLLWGEWALVRFFDASSNAELDLSFYGLGIGVIIDDE